MDSATTVERLQQLRANLIANRMNKEKEEKDASMPSAFSTAQAATPSGMSPLSSIAKTSPFIPGLSIFQQKLATPQATGSLRPSRFGEPSPPRQLQAAAASRPASFAAFGASPPPSQLQEAKPVQSAVWVAPCSPMFGQSQQTTTVQNASPHPQQSKGPLVDVQQVTEPLYTSRQGPPTMSDQKPASPPGQDFSPWSPPQSGERALVKLPPSDDRAAGVITGSGTDNVGEATTRCDALMRPSTPSEREDLPDLDIWLEITGYHDVEYRETAVRKYNVEKMIAERRKALEDAEAELASLLQRPVNGADFTSRLSTPRHDNTGAEKDGLPTATHITDIDSTTQVSTGAKRARSPSPGMSAPAKRLDTRGDIEQSKPPHETDFGRRLTFPDAPHRASSYYRPSTQPSLQDTRGRSFRDGSREPSERSSPKRRDYSGYGPYRASSVSDRDLDRIRREQQAAKYRRSVAKATNTSDSEAERK